MPDKEFEMSELEKKVSDEIAFSDKPISKCLDALKKEEILKELDSTPFNENEVEVIVLEVLNNLPLEVLIFEALKPVFDKGLEGSRIVNERDELKEQVKKLKEICRLFVPGFDFEREIRA